VVSRSTIGVSAMSTPLDDARVCSCACGPRDGFLTESGVVATMTLILGDSLERDVDIGDIDVDEMILNARFMRHKLGRTAPQPDAEERAQYR